MKAMCTLTLVMSLGLASLAAQEESAVRALDSATVEAHAFGVDASPTFRALLRAFDPGAVVVHVLSGEFLTFGTSGSTRFAGVAGAWRYLQVTVDPALPVDERTAVLAHELQHAREIADAAPASQHEVRQLYERIGNRADGGRDAFETTAAVAIGRRVWRELRASMTSTESPAEGPAPASGSRLGEE